MAIGVLGVFDMDSGLGGAVAYSGVNYAYQQTMHDHALP